MVVYWPENRVCRIVEKHFEFIDLLMENLFKFQFEVELKAILKVQLAITSQVMLRTLRMRSKVAQLALPTMAVQCCSHP